MSKSGGTFNKKELEKKRAQHRQEKAEKREERRAHAQKGKSLNEMMAYLDENGNITSTPPDPSKKKVINYEEIQISVPQKTHEEPEHDVRTGVVAFFNESKGFGFINDLETEERVFVHVQHLSEPIRENDKVTFEVEMSHKGASAYNVKKVTEVSDNQ
ncbi:cold shock domain-containing protein [Chitinophagaceae bacterium LB-8]|uniref:Cold shock domain-containing protein n=1 Tax=Paraflavisolibacter caeni TaxID=2982496 RepID=A0A9X2XZA5_9BACT|nr:cold shock domain-containing protein [Paraflavisolibacter caeni]MCU7551622.1 cold shock domain-containing protein [Paraflavisolibacter caeni]